MKIIFKELRIENFKNHKSLLVEFGEVTNIAGRNGAGKSSIGDAVTWALYGTDTMGSKLDPKPIDAEEGTETRVELWIRFNDKDILLSRTQKKTAKYFINEIPKKATEFNELLDEIFDKNLFLSLFNPAYFFTQHWQDQRTQLLQYVKEPLNKEVLAELPKVLQTELEEPLKKHNLDDLEKLHREKAKQGKSNYERAAERVLTLEEQFSKTEEPSVDVEKYQKEIESLHGQRAAIDEENADRQKQIIARNRIEGQIDNLSTQINQQKNIVQSIKDEEIQDACTTCGQPLKEDAITKVKENRQGRFNKEVAKGKELVQKVNELKQLLAAMPEPADIDRTKLNEIEDKLMELQMKVKSSGMQKELEQDLQEAKVRKEQLRKEKNDSQSMVDAIKEFRAKRSELMVQKVDDLFSTIKVRLYETLKNGEERATFEIEMDGKPYSKLSTAEKIKAGLELIEVISKQSEVITPTFIDNAESILRFTAPSGQPIVARVKDVDLDIQPISEEVLS
ncbi:AAA family ATPase [Bacillus sp. AK031]